MIASQNSKRLSWLISLNNSSNQYYFIVQLFKLDQMTWWLSKQFVPVQFLYVLCLVRWVIVVKVMEIRTSIKASFYCKVDEKVKNREMKWASSVGMKKVSLYFWVLTVMHFFCYNQSKVCNKILMLEYIKKYNFVTIFDMQ